MAKQKKYEELTELEKAKRYIAQSEDFKALLAKKELKEVSPFKFDSIIHCIMLSKHYKLHKINGYQVIFSTINEFHTIKIN